jgi:hypothetical protein
VFADNSSIQARIGLVGGHVVAAKTTIVEKTTSHDEAFSIDDVFSANAAIHASKGEVGGHKVAAKTNIVEKPASHDGAFSTEDVSVAKEEHWTVFFIRICASKHNGWHGSITFLCTRR